MKTTTPAKISYLLNGELQDINFHAVYVEEHEVSSETTKYPIQTGFQITNHAIRKNRKVSIEAIITNSVMTDSKNSFIYSSNNSKSVYQLLKDLVNKKIKCKVITNLDVYEPVLFTRFRTKQKAGLVDAMHLIVSGEELQVVTTPNKTAPKTVALGPILPEEETASQAFWNEAGIDFNLEDKEYKKGEVVLGEDFVMVGNNEAGEPITTTYVAKGKDPVTGNEQYEVHSDDKPVYGDKPDNRLRENIKIESDKNSELFKKYDRISDGDATLRDSKSTFSNLGGTSEFEETVTYEDGSTATGSTVRVWSPSGELTKETKFGIHKENVTIPGNSKGIPLDGSASGSTLISNNAESSFDSNIDRLPTSSNMVEGARSHGKIVSSETDLKLTTNKPRSVNTVEAQQSFIRDGF